MPHRISYTTRHDYNPTAILISRQQVPKTSYNTTTMLRVCLIYREILYSLENKYFSYLFLVFGKYAENVISKPFVYNFGKHYGVDVGDKGVGEECEGVCCIRQLVLDVTMELVFPISTR